MCRKETLCCLLSIEKKEGRQVPSRPHLPVSPPSLQVLLPLSAILLLLLGGSTLLAWRMVQRRAKGESAPSAPPAPGWAGPDHTLTSSGSVSLFPRMALNAYPQTTCPGWPWGAEARGGVPHLADTGCERWHPSRRPFPWWGLGWLPCDVPLLFKALP